MAVLSMVEASNLPMLRAGIAAMGDVGDGNTSPIAYIAHRLHRMLRKVCPEELRETLRSQ
ncbi:MAG: hypothetical protein HY741_05190 [Chloroflexi bacterium]|nr:hypothetical protein [Chloroflexota bacterium]